VHVPAFRTVAFQNLQSSFKIDNGRVFTGPAVLHGSQGDWQAAGSIGLDGTLDYAVSVTVPPALVQQLGARSALAAGALADDQGRILMDFRVTGPATAPRVAWDPEAMRARLSGRMSHAIDEQKQKFEQLVRDSIAARTHVAQDSSRIAADRVRRALRDSLEHRGRDLLKGLLGGETADSAHK
jgi:AsmA-like C-terminal region